MKKLLFLFLFLFISASPVSAQKQWEGNDSLPENYFLGPGDIINEDVFAAGERVDIAGTVNGDVYAAGGQIYVSGHITGDLLAAGGSVNISGIIGEDLRVTGGNITLSGRVGKNASIAAGNITLTENADINGGLSALFGNLDSYGTVNRYFRGAGGNFTLAGNVGGDVEAAVGSLNIRDRSQIFGDLTYWSKSQGTIAENAQITGRTVFNQAEGYNPDTSGIKKTASSGFRIGSFIFTFILGIIYIVLFPGHLNKAAKIIREKSIQSFFWGLVSPLLIFFLALVLTLTLIGIPLAFFILFLYFFIVYISRIPVIYFLGNLLPGFNEKDKPVLSFTAGLIIYWLLTLIPYVGGLIKLVAVAIGIGSFFLAFKAKTVSPEISVRLGRKKK